MHIVATLPVDGGLFKVLSSLTGKQSDKILLGVIGEVKANKTVEKPSPNPEWKSA